MKHVVDIIGEECEVHVNQSSKSVWIAGGAVEGDYFTVKDRSANTALRSWIAAAKYRRARN